MTIAIIDTVVAPAYKNLMEKIAFEDRTVCKPIKQAGQHHECACDSRTQTYIICILDHNEHAYGCPNKVSPDITNSIAYILPD